LNPADRKLPAGFSFASRVAATMKYLKSNGLSEDFRLTSRKLGLGPRALGEFNLVMQRRDLA
jgi:hypothetical protein